MRGKQDKPIEIRDLRRKEYFQVDDVYLNGYARICGIYATGVYIALCRHVNSVNQSCFPSIDLIAKKLNISKSQVIRALKKLEELNLIKKEKVDGKNNRYYLIDKNHWKTSVSQTPVSNGYQCQAETGVSQTPTSVPQTPELVSDRHPKVTHLNEHNKDLSRERLFEEAQKLFPRYRLSKNFLL